MKGYARVLKIIATIGFWIMVIGLIGVCAAEAVIAFRPDLIPADLPGAASFTINGSPVDLHQLAAYRTPALIIMGVMILQLILTLVLISRIGAALKEVIQEAPFSAKCSGALNTAALMVLLRGIIAMGINFYSAVALHDLTPGSSPVVNTTSSLTFILVFIFLKMLAGISEFGRREQ